MLARFQLAREGHGQAVLVTGEPGIGKSRLLFELGERLRDEPHFLLECRSSPYHTSHALHPVIEMLSRLARLEDTHTPDEKRERLARALEPVGATPETVALLTDALSLPPDEARSPLELTPQKRKQKTLEALLQLVLAASARKPVLLRGRGPALARPLERRGARRAGAPGDGSGRARDRDRAAGHEPGVGGRRARDAPRAAPAHAPADGAARRARGRSRRPARRDRGAGAEPDRRHPALRRGADARDLRRRGGGRRRQAAHGRGARQLRAGDAAGVARRAARPAGLREGHRPARRRAGARVPAALARGRLAAVGRRRSAASSSGWSTRACCSRAGRPRPPPTCSSTGWCRRRPTRRCSRRRASSTTRRWRARSRSSSPRPRPRSRTSWRITSRRPARPRPRSSGGRARRGARASASRAARPWPTCGGRSSCWPRCLQDRERDGHELGLQMGLCALLPSVERVRLGRDRAGVPARAGAVRPGRSRRGQLLRPPRALGLSPRLRPARGRARARAGAPRGGARARRHALGPRRSLRARLHARGHRRDRGRAPPPRAGDGRRRGRSRSRPELSRRDGAGHHDTGVLGDAAVAARPPRRGARAGPGHGRQGARRSATR